MNKEKWTKKIMEEKWIKEIIGGAVEGHGFKYMGCTRNEYIDDYCYKRIKEGMGISWEIIIGIKLDEMELMFMTSVSGENIHASGLIESDFKIDDQNRWITWKGEEEFKQVLYHFREIILKKGFDMLEEITRKTPEDMLMDELDLKLYQEHKALNKEYRKRYGLENIKSTEELMKRISTIIVESGDKAFTEAQEILMGMAAVYGEELVKKCWGIWFWHRRSNSCLIRGVRYRIENPLATVVNYWKRREDNPEVLSSRVQ